MVSFLNVNSELLETYSQLLAITRNLLGTDSILLENDLES